MIRDGIALLPIRRRKRIAPDDADDAKQDGERRRPRQDRPHQPEKTPWIRIMMKPVAGFADTTADQDVFIHNGLICDMTLGFEAARNFRIDWHRMTNYWLVKSEPDAFSWDQQVENGVEPWTGVRNHSAKNNLKAMKKGDLAFFYHSNIGKEIVGIVRVAREAYPDPSAESGDWVCVDMQAVGPVPQADFTCNHQGGPQV